MSKKKEAKKAKMYLATIIPESGSPFEAEVQADDDGTITHGEMTWHISSNSVWTSGKQRRIILPEGSAESFHGGMLSGKYYMKASLFFYYIKMKLLEQLFNLQNRKPWYKTGSTWLIAGAIGLLCLVIVWLVITLDGGLKHIVETIAASLQDSAQNSGEGTGHNPISPEG